MNTHLDDPEWPSVTLCVPYYNQPAMLKYQLGVWDALPGNIRIIVVDDGSAEGAAQVVKWHSSDSLRDRLELYRIDIDIPWNRGGARNLAASRVSTDWLIHIDIDHVLRPKSAAHLAAFAPNPAHWYRFPRDRIGAADETRNKDALPRDVAFGAIKPHGDSYLCTTALYWRAGGYNEDFSGCLGGGSPFLTELEKEGPAHVLPESVRLEVHTRHSVADASTPQLSRDTGEYSRRKAAMRGNVRSDKRLRFPWRRVL